MSTVKDGAPEWKRRVSEEYDEMVAKVAKLDAFLGKSDSGEVKLDEVTQMMLRTQLFAMSAYTGCLWLRLRTTVQVIPEAANEAGPADPAV